MTRPSPHHGFTLLELLVVIAVLAILALVALPNFTDRLVREQVVEGLTLAAIAKPPVEAAWRLGQPLPADNAAAGLPAADRIVNNVVSAVTVQDGAIQIRFGNRANPKLSGKTLSLRPAVVDDATIVPVTWLCGMAAAPGKMTAKGINRTDVPVALLPLRCR